jgi:hypothetical protein
VSDLTVPRRVWVSRARWLVSAFHVRLKMSMLKLAYKAGFNPEQPRAPAGTSEGGQWVDDGGGSYRLTPASARGRSGEGAYSSFPGSTPAQHARLETAAAQAGAAVARLQRVDPNWRPRPGLNQTIEGAIAQNEAVIREANGRHVEILRKLAGPGPYARESLPRRGPYTRVTPAERLQLNEIGDRCGCHTCGAVRSGHPSGSWFYDHQSSSALGRPRGRSADIAPLRIL